VLVNSPGNPTGAVFTADEMHTLANLCRERNLLLISDEVYKAFCFDGPFSTPATTNPDVLVVDGFSKAHGMTGWRLGYAHGPTRLIQEMATLQQFSYVCAPSIAQWGGIAALDVELTPRVDAYRIKRDLVVAGLADHYELPHLGGAFYAFFPVPDRYPSATDFVAESIRRNLLIIPGNVFSRRDTHVRISYAVDEATLARGLAVLRDMA